VGERQSSSVNGLSIQRLRLEPLSFKLERDLIGFGMNVIPHRVLSTIFGALLFASCDAGSLVTDPPEEPIVPVDPKVPTSMSDCIDGEIFASQAPMRMLTRYEYDNTIRDLLGVQTSIARTKFPPENAVAGFENNSDSHRVSPLLSRRLMEAAEELTPLALPQVKARLSCQNEDAACGRDFVQSFLFRAFRRPPTAEELRPFQDLFDVTRAESGFDDAVELTIQAVLQSPQFLYRIEPSDRLSPGSLVEVDAFSMASRLSYFLWGSMPDDKLLDAAKEGRLHTEADIETQTRRMLADARSETLIFEFYRQWLGLDALNTMVKDESAFPEWNESLTREWMASLRAFIQTIHSRNGGVEELLTSNSMHITGSMATLYNIPGTPNAGMAEYLMPTEERAGLLTHPTVMALLAYPSQSSPIHRGIFVRERLLCQKLPSPPDNLEIEPPDPNPTATTREIFEAHVADASCNACHRLIDPIGLGFENYDTLGRYRTYEHGLQVDASGALTNTADPSIQGEFNGAVQLSHMLKDAREVRDCVADHWFTFAQGHPETLPDMCSADQIRERFHASDGKFEDLFVAITTSDAFRYRTIQVQGENP